jgi:hypothetical protein
MCQDSKVFVWNEDVLGDVPEMYVIVDRSNEYPNLYEIACPNCTTHEVSPTQARAA